MAQDDEGTWKGFTLSEGQELVFGSHRVLIDSIDCIPKRVKVRARSTEHIRVAQTPAQDKKPCKATS